MKLIILFLHCKMHIFLCCTSYQNSVKEFELYLIHLTKYIKFMSYKWKQILSDFIKMN